MKICVTGAAGFIGSNLAKRLISEGHEVIGIDNFSHGSRRNIEGLDMQFIEGDLTCDETLKGLKFDVCVHLASQKIPRYEDAFCTLEYNHEMLSQVIYACLYNDAKLVFSSTSDVYGKNPADSFAEDADLVLGPTTVKRWAYATSKIHAEQYIQACSAHYGLDYVIMRFFSAYGPNQNVTWWGGPQGLFIQNLIEGKPLEIHGDGYQSRCFTYIDDLVDGILICMEQKNDIYNIGNPSALINIRGLALMIAGLMDVQPVLNFVPYETFGKYEDVRVRVPNIDKLRDKGYEPQYNLFEGLKKTIEWQRNSQ